MRILLLARALARSHYGPETLVAVGSVAGALLLAGLQAVPSLDHGYPLHLFTLGPGVVAVVTSVATGNKLADLGLSVDHRLALFRGCWCLVVVSLCCLLMWPVAVAMNRGEIVGTTAVLVATTFAVSTLVKSAAWCLGAANTVLAIALPRIDADTDPVTGWMRSAGHACGLEVLALVVTAALLYATFGEPRRRRIRAAS